MTEGQLVLDICRDFNDKPPQVVIHDAFNPVDVEVAIMDGDFSVDERLEKYRDQMTEKTFHALAEMLREKMKKSILTRVKEMKGETGD